MSHYIKELQHIVEEYRAAEHPWPAEMSSIADWAISTGRWKPSPAIAIRACAEDLARAMREEYFTDRNGRRARTKHPVKVMRQGRQMTLWDDMRTAPREHMRMAFQQRRRQIVGDCRQLKVDLDCYNGLNASQHPLQVVFDFTNDLAEIEAAAA
jgi:hypothetical protein